MLKVGNVVQIICQKYVEYLAFGEIVEIKTDNTVVIEIPKIFPNQTRIIQCHADDVELHEDYPGTIKACQLFGKLGWLYYCGIIPPFSPDADCQYQNCSSKASRRAMINIMGTVCEADLCDKHANEYHGTQQEIFPWKKKEPA